MYIIRYLQKQNVVAQKLPKKYHPRYLLKVVLSLLITCYSFSVFASCDRTDIDHYLDKGFTPKQITSICSYFADNKKKGVLAKEDPKVYLLKAIKAKDIDFLMDRFYFISRRCLELSPIPIQSTHRAERFCGLIKTTILFRGIKTVDSKLFSLDFSLKNRSYVRVSGNIFQVIVDEKYKSLSNRKKKRIATSLENIEIIKLPIYEGVKLDDVKLKIAELSN